MQRTQMEVQDGAAWITLDDGKVNAMSREMLAEISSHLAEARRLADVTVIRGRKGIFSAGFDLNAMASSPAQSIAMVREGGQLVREFLSHPNPVVAVCTGHAYPMGAFLMLSADSRVGVSGPYRIGMNETAIGLTVPRFALALARTRLSRPGFARVGVATLFEPEQAREVGYLDHVVEESALDSFVHDEVVRLRALDLPSFTATKARMNEILLAELEREIDAELAEVA